MVRRPGEARHIQLEDVVGGGNFRQATLRLVVRSHRATNRQSSSREDMVARQDDTHVRV